MAELTINVIHQGDRREEQLTPARLVSACLVVGIHVALIIWLAGRTIATRQTETVAQPMVAEILAAIQSESPMAGMQVIPIQQPVQLDIPTLPISAEPDLAIDAPRIDPALAVNIATYSARADLKPGFIATVLLLLEISPDGSVLSAKVVRSNGEEAANVAAIQYAHATRWMPGKVGGEPRAMQASLTVILGERG